MVTEKSKFQSQLGAFLEKLISDPESYENNAFSNFSLFFISLQALMTVIFPHLKIGSRRGDCQEIIL